MNLILKSSFKFFGTMRLSIIVTAVFLSACSSTQTNQIVTSEAIYHRLSQSCIDSILLQQSQQVEQYNVSTLMSLARRAETCLGDQKFPVDHPDVQTAMQFNALAFANYMKAGDIEAANRSFERFTLSFPQQDLIYSDFTSFIDTATALLNYQGLSVHQLQILDINPTLRSELLRRKRWASL